MTDYFSARGLLERRCADWQDTIAGGGLCNRGLACQNAITPENSLARP